ncbi:hypothetical protein Ae201684P_013588 [Aphanomyces euteiches]|uniref:acetylornithine transaminase n=1 Tax=Aphanomyces euteiches TaxID=100861 RepID=A0A6G0WDU4_9STRA|nr:hypothetical protein Ae201684_016164 [Aphanomyces euteiches]KAH9052085.1 hypothetical protein Ae201684P_013588 [Aphanomyces euteiches]
MLALHRRAASTFSRLSRASMSFSSTAASKVEDHEELSPEATENQFIVKTYNSNGVRTKEGLLITHGKGPYLFDSRGNKFLDFYSGIAVTALGHADPQVTEAITAQAQKLSHVSNLFHSEPPLRLAKTLVENSSFDKVFFANSGTEANEGAYKFARLYANKITKDTPLEGKKNHVIAFKGGFHGRSSGALSLTYKPAIREPFLPLLPGISFAEYNNLDDVRRLISDQTCAIIVESIQGEGGVLPATADFLPGLRALADEFKALLIVDEVQTGLGRTGKLFGHEVYGVQPDIITLAKPLANGLPIGAVLTKNHVAEAVTAGAHGTTFGGNPLVCEAANVVVNRILEPGFLLHVQKMGRILAHGLKNIKLKHSGKVADVRLPIGEAGLYAGVEFVGPVAPIIGELVNHGVLAITAGEKVLRICPPLVVLEEDVNHFISALDSAVEKHNF